MVAYLISCLKETLRISLRLQYRNTCHNVQPNAAANENKKIELRSNFYNKTKKGKLPNFIGHKPGFIPEIDFFLRKIQNH
jgi:hypothetical protein